MTRRLPDWAEFVVTTCLFLACYDLMGILAMRSMGVLVGATSEVRLWFGLLVLLGGGMLIAHMLLDLARPARRDELRRIFDSPWDGRVGFMFLAVVCMIPAGMSLNAATYLLPFIP